MKHSYRLFANGKYHIFRNRKVYRAAYDFYYDDRALLRIIKERYLACLENKELIKYFFSINDTMESINKKNQEKRLQLKIIIYIYKWQR